MEKYKELFNFSKEVFKQELERFNELDKKASQYLTTLTLLIGIAGFYLNWILNNFVPAQTFQDVLLVILAILILVSLVTAWFYVFSVLKMYEIYKLPLDDETLKFFCDNKEIDIYYYMSIGIKDALEENRRIGDTKSERLLNGYKIIRITVILLVTFSSLFGFYKWNKPNTDLQGVSSMPKDNQQKPNTQPAPTSQPTPTPEPSKPVNTTPEQPTPNITPPKFPKVTHGDKPMDIRDSNPNNINMNKR